MIASGMFSGLGAAGAAAGTATASSSPALTRWLGSQIVRPLIATCPARMSAFKRERDRSFITAASVRSSRAPASAAATAAVRTIGASIGASTGASIWASASLMSNPDIDDDEPLSPAQAQIVARVRWLMLISGMATVLGIAVVITVIGYRVFRTEGRQGPVETTILLPKGARVASTAVAGDRIVVTVDIGGTLEIRTFDTKTLSPEGRLRFAIEP